MLLDYLHAHKSAIADLGGRGRAVFGALQTSVTAMLDQDAG